MEPPPDCLPCYVREDANVIASDTPLQKKDEEKGKNGSEFLVIKSEEDGIGLSKMRDQQLCKSLPLSPTHPVRSSAIIAYSATKNNAVFSRLAPKTDLNLAPSNWLRKTVGLRPEVLLPGGRHTVNPNRSFSGFSMASSHLDCVGKVDVVSDAENIKKLLKMPYSKGHVSMAIHRIGRTLLLEDFDIKRYTAEESEWQWFRSFYQELVQQQGSNKLLKKKCASSQYDRLMLSKFLYYSICNDYYNKLEDKHQSSDEQENTGSNVKLVEIDEKFKELLTESEEVRPFCSSASIPEQRDEAGESGPLVAAEKRWRYWTPNESFQSQAPSEEFERNILWTFEDLQMMLGTNMPIFGGGKYPAVSLRLRDSNKPINILTGIDYWLDNLICNVPELVMCFHVNGIVQNYEVIKTEDIPKLDYSSFSPQVVKDIAQNILSFLKSNCTKEGHTYWLFKGSGDDVVKLYDLTTLCNTTPDESATNKSAQQNPYIYSVAMLLYKTAISLMQSQDTCDHHITVKKLLEHCIDLLDHSKYQYVVCSAICILSTLSLPDPGLDKLPKEGSQPMKENDTSSSSFDWKTCDTCTSHYNSDFADTRKNSERTRSTEEIASIPRVTDLSIKAKYQSIPASFDLIRSPPARARGRHRSNPNDQAGQVEESCQNVLSYVVLGFKALAQNATIEWRKSLLRQLTRNAALAYFRLAEQASCLGKLGRALRSSRLALQSYETYDFISVRHPENCDNDPGQTHMIPPDFHLLLPRLLSLCGELQFAVVQDIRSRGAVSSSDTNEFTSFTEEDKKICDALNNVLLSVQRYTSLTQLTSELDQALSACERCYETALDVIKGHTGVKNTLHHETKAGVKEVKQKGKAKSKKSPESHQQTSAPVMDTHQSNAVEQLRTTLIRRHGHIVNEIGASVLNKAVGFLSNDQSQDPADQKIWDTWNEANSYFERAYNSFVQVDDFINQALVLSNMGRLMRVSAQFYSNKEAGLLSQQERRCFMSAIEKYQKALALLGPRDRGFVMYEAVYDNISWELSTSYYTMAQILQDNAPLEKRASEEAEKEVISLMSHSLKYCKDIWDNSPKGSIALYRQAKIHYRIASLHHNSYRNCTDAHKRKQLRTLADTHYEKSVKLFEALENHNELLRSQLERLALKEQHIASVNGVNQKLKLLIDGLVAICDCSKALKMVEKSTKLTRANSVASQVDAGERASSEMDATNVTEIAPLLQILCTILESYLLSLVRLTSLSRDPTSIKKGKIPDNLQPRIYKDLCSRALRTLQPVKASGNGVEIGFEKVHGNVLLVLKVLNDVSVAVSM